METNKRVFRKLLYQQVADDIEVAILNGSFPPDSKLPSEQQLANEYGVSRNVIREALKRLKERGLVSIKTGSGTFVSRPTTEPVSDALHRLLMYANNTVSVTHFYEIRRMIEPKVARLAAERATGEDITSIQEAYDLMVENHHDRAAWTQADLGFHLAVADTTRNPLIQSILKPLNKPLMKVIEAGMMAEPSGVDAGLSAHLKIMNAIQNHDPAQAEQAMLEHLEDSEQRVSKLDFEFER